jgi:hypothetical protein
VAATDPNFDEQGFRDGIHFAMSLGLPVDDEDRPSFHFPDTSSVGSPVDDEGIPFDPNARPVVTRGQVVKVPCAIEYVDAPGQVESWGIIYPSKVVLTFLGEDFELIRGFDYVVIGGNRYNYRSTRSPVAMDVVPVWQVECTAEDQK